MALLGVRAPVQEHKLLEQVDITGPQELVSLSVDVGSTRTEVLRNLGEPSFAYPEYDIYVVENMIGADRILIRYRSGIVNSVTWEYFID